MANGKDKVIDCNLVPVHKALRQIIEKLKDKPNTATTKKIRAAAKRMLDETDCGQPNHLDLITGKVIPKSR